MTKKKPRELVVDACVARSAGETEHPVSSACRVLLRHILEICHHVVLDRNLSDEWGRHQSRFTRKWRREMAARQKPLRVIVPDPSGLGLEKFPEDARMAVEKDLHVLETALSSGQEIVTSDDALFRALGTIKAGERLRTRITWHHPVRDGISNL